MTDTHFILKWISKPLKCTSSFFSFFCIQFFPDPFSFIYSSFTLILLISACSRFSFFVPVSRLLPLASVSNPGLLSLRCIYGFPAYIRTLLLLKICQLSNSFGSWLIRLQQKLPWLWAFKDFLLWRFLLRFRPYLFRSLNLCLSAIRCCPISLPIETILLFLRCSFLEFHPGGSFSCLILNVVFILLYFRM